MIFISKKLAIGNYVSNMEDFISMSYEKKRKQLVSEPTALVVWLAQFDCRVIFDHV